MGKSVFKKLMARRAPKAGASALAVAGVALVLVTQNVGTASAWTQKSTGEGWLCHEGTACLYNDVHKDGASSHHLIISEDAGSGPDLEATTPEGLGMVRSMPSEFHDKISQAYNLMPYDLCLIDTHPLGNGEYKSWGAIMTVPAKGGEFASGYKQPFNDSFDTYTTARPGQCPTEIRLRGSDAHILARD